MDAHYASRSSEQVSRPPAAVSVTLHSASLDPRTRSEDSWVEIASQPSSSSLSSAADEVITTGLRVQQDPRTRLRRSLRQNRPTHPNMSHRPVSAGGTSSQEEYEESESESDRIMTSSGEGLYPPSHVFARPDMSPAQLSSPSPNSMEEDDEDDDDEDRTAINYPRGNDQCFTPQPNAFSHPPSSQWRDASHPVPGSYFPAQRPASRPAPRPSPRHSLPTPRHTSHMPQNILSPSYNAAAHHDEALRSSLNTLLSCAAAARGLTKTDPSKREQAITATNPGPARGNKVETASLRLVPESQLPTTTRSGAASVPSPPAPQFHEPTFHPTIRRTSTSTTTTSSSAERHLKEIKRKARNPSRGDDRRSVKKPRRTSASDATSTAADLLHVSPTLLTWVVSAGVVVFLSALSFSAGYSLGREAARFEAGVGGVGGSAGGSFTAGGGGADAQIRSACAREAGRSGLGFKRSLARSAVQV